MNTSFDLNSTREVIGACPHDCPDTCSIISTLQNNVLLHVRGNSSHPHTDGILCKKVSQYAQRLQHTERLLFPLKRIGKKGGGHWQRISWEQALSEIASRLKTICAEDAETLLPYHYGGTMGLVQSQSISSRFFHHLGASRLNRTICASAGGEAMLAHLGKRTGTRVEAFAQAKFIVIWGANPVVSSVHFWRYAAQAKRNGAYVVAIDPRVSETSKLCNEHIALMPGTDGAFALAVAHVLIRDQSIDQDYLDQYTLNFSTFAEYVKTFTPAYAANICKISAQCIEDFAKRYAQNAPKAAIRLNYGMQRTRGGGQAVAAVLSLPALVGAWRHASGGVLLSSSGEFPTNTNALQRPELALHNEKLPRLINMSTLGHALSLDTEKPINALFIYNSNPLAVAPDATQVLQGLKRENLLTVVAEHFMTDTCDYADYVLPATMQMEHIDIHASYGHTNILWNEPALAPAGECLSNTEIFRRLAKAMHLEEPSLYEDDLSIARNAFDWQHPSLQHTCFDELRQKGWVDLKLDAALFAEGKFGTPSGKFEFVSSYLRSLGKQPHIRYVAPLENVDSELAQHYPLVLITPPARNFLNSSFVNIQSLRKPHDHPYIIIHPQDAAKRLIQTGMTIEIFNARGHYRSIVVVSEDTRVGVVVAHGVWWRKYGMDYNNVNDLTGQHLTDIGEGACFYDCLVEARVAYC